MEIFYLFLNMLAFALKWYEIAKICESENVMKQSYISSTNNNLLIFGMWLFFLLILDRFRIIKKKKKETWYAQNHRFNIRGQSTFLWKMSGLLYPVSEPSFRRTFSRQNPWIKWESNNKNCWVHWKIYSFNGCTFATKL